MILFNFDDEYNAFNLILKSLKMLSNAQRIGFEFKHKFILIYKYILKKSILFTKIKAFISQIYWRFVQTKFSTIKIGRENWLKQKKYYTRETN